MSPFNETLDGPSSPRNVNDTTNNNNTNNNNNNNRNHHADHLVPPSSSSCRAKVLLDGSAITDSINFRHKMGQQQQQQQQRPIIATTTAMRMRPPSDIPSASSSGSTIVILQPPTPTRASPSSSSSDYRNPVQLQIREVMERSKELERQQKQQREREQQQRELEQQQQQQRERDQHLQRKHQAHHQLAYEQHPHHVRAHAREVAQQNAQRQWNETSRHRSNEEGGEPPSSDGGGGGGGGRGNGGGNVGGNGKGGGNVIHGLHMDHFINYDAAMSSPNTLSPPHSPLSPRFERYGAWSPSSPPYNDTSLVHPRPFSSSLPPNLNNLPIDLTNNTNILLINSLLNNNNNNVNSSNLPPNTIDHATGEYVIEGSFQSKGCILQTADDVGYLFGCGTKPQDEVVYVYNTKAVVDGTTEPPPTAKADERNLWYHMGPDYDVRNRTDGGGADNINDVLFQIDREYLTMKAAHEGNMMGLVNNEFLRDPPPPPHGHYRVVHEDDVIGSPRSNGCGLMEFILPVRRRDERDPPREDHHVDDNNNNNNYDPTFNYQPNVNHLRESEEKYYTTNYFCSGGRAKRRQQYQRRNSSPQLQQHHPHHHHPNLASPSNQSADGSTSSIEKAKKGVVELQNQLKAMVHVRAMRQQQQQQQHGKTTGGGTSSGSNGDFHHPKETRQESTNTPPDSPLHSTSTMIAGNNHHRNGEPMGASNNNNNNQRWNADEEAAREASEARLSSAKAEIERLRREATSLDRARRSLQDELADHQRKMTDMMNATHRDEREWEMEQRWKDERKGEAERLNEKERVLEESREVLRRELKEHREKMTAMNATNAMNAMSAMNTATTQYNSQLQQQQQQQGNYMSGAAAPLSPMTAMTSSMLPVMMTSEQVGNIGMAPPSNMPMNDGMVSGMGNGMGNHALNTGMNSGMNNPMSTGMMGNGMNVGANNGMNTHGSGVNNMSMGNYMNNGMVSGSGMMRNNNMNNGISHGGELPKKQQQYTSPERADPPSQIEVNSILKDPNSILDSSIIAGGYTNRYANNDGKTTVASKSMFSGGGPSLRSEGKFIDNVAGIGASYNLRPQVSPERRRSPPSRPNKIQPRDPQPSPRYQTRDPRPSRPQGRAMPRSYPLGLARSYPAHANSDELSQSNTMLHELKVKNKLINEDIMRIKKSMSTRYGSKGGSPKNRSPSNYKGGTNVASGAQVDHATKPSTRPFPRTSPPSSPKESYRYQEDPSRRVMRRSDDARTQRVFNFSGGASGSPRTGSQHNQYQPSGHHRPSQSQDRHIGGGGHQQQGGYATRQPPQPMRLRKEQGQTY